MQHCQLDPLCSFLRLGSTVHVRPNRNNAILGEVNERIRECETPQKAEWSVVIFVVESWNSQHGKS